MLPELQEPGQHGSLDRRTLQCICLLWCKDDDYQSTNKDNFFKELSRENSILFLIERMVRVATILVYGRLKDFNISKEQFFIEQEIETLNQKIHDLVVQIYKKMQIDQENMDQSEIEKRIRIPRLVYDSTELRQKLTILAFQNDAFDL